jgi:hypothetical protein
MPQNDLRRRATADRSWDSWTAPRERVFDERARVIVWDGRDEPRN